jgi:copper chaperone NosL
MLSRAAPLVTAAALGLVLSSCAAAADPSVPPEIVYGEDVCAHCGMIISEPRFAAASWVASDTGPAARLFDDIGDLVAYEDQNPDLHVLSRYVHDYRTEEWLDAEDATFVRTEAASTPMGSGVVAFGDFDDAVDFAAANHGQVIDLDGLLASGDELMHQSHQPAP